MDHTLLLTKGFQPLKLIDWKKAFTLWALGKVEIIDTYEKVVRSARQAFAVPSVVRLLDKVPWKSGQIGKVRFSRPNIYRRDKYICQYCGNKFRTEELTFDHVMPRSRGGGTTWENIVTACRRCNHRKGNRTPKEANMPLLRAPYKPDAKDVEPAATVWQKWLDSFKDK